MPRPGPPRRRVSFRLDASHLEWLASQAEQRGVSQGQIIRELIDRTVNKKSPRKNDD